MSDDDAADDGDWFERALTEGEEPPVDGEGHDDGAADRDAAGDDRTGDEDVGSEDGDGDIHGDGDGGGGSDRGEDDGSDDENDGQSAGDAPGAPSFDAADPDRDALDAAFEEATAAASDDPTDGLAGEPEDGATASPDVAGIEGDDVDPFDGGGEGDFGPGTDDGGGDLFEDDLSSAFGGSDGGDDEFDDEDFDSAIPRIDVGIEGLDRMIQGGIPERHLITTIGSAGTGKTTFGLQYLNHGLERGENAVFITLEQSHDSIIDTAAEHGFDFEGYEGDGSLAVVDLDPVEMANSLDNIRGELPTLVEEFGADRFVLDSVSLLEMMYDQQARRRMEIYDFTRSLKRAGVTTLLTSEADEDNPYASRHGIIEYLTDAVFLLQFVRGETNETRLAVEIQKIRNANHSRETKPYEITTEGISVYEQANIF